MTTETAARFVNLQTVTVNIPREGGGTQMVQPFRKLQARPTDPTVMTECVVAGEYYRQFVSDKGPLYPFPDEAADEIDEAQGVAAAVTGAGVPPLSTHQDAMAEKNAKTAPLGMVAQSGPGSAKVTGDVIGPDGEVKTEPAERALDESLRILADTPERFQQLRDAGINTVAELASERNLPQLGGVEGAAELHAAARAMLGLSVPDTEDAEDDDEPEETTPSRPAAKKTVTRKPPTKKKTTKKKPARKGRRG